MAEVVEFTHDVFDMTCPSCQAGESSIREIVDDSTGVPALECGECGHVFGHAPF